MDLEINVQRGVRANEVLENETYQEAYALLKQEIIEQWQNSPARDQDGREKLFLMIGLLDKIQSIMKTTMETGKLSSLELEHKKNMLEKAKALAKDFL